jgi:hypothetical protein
LTDFLDLEIESTWWNTMDDDITSTKRPASEDSPAPKASTSSPEPSSSKAAPTKESSPEEEHTLLGDLWKGAKRFFGSDGQPEKK